MEVYRTKRAYHRHLLNYRTRPKDFWRQIDKLELIKDVRKKVDQIIILKDLIYCEIVHNSTAVLHIWKLYLCSIATALAAAREITIAHTYIYTILSIYLNPSLCHTRTGKSLSNSDL